LSADPAEPLRQLSVDVLETSLDAVVVIDADGLVRAWNPAAETLFGYARDQAIGSELGGLIIPGPLREAHRNGLRRYVAVGESTILNRRIELTAMRRDGTEFAVELAITRLPGTAEPLFAGHVRDLESRAEAHRANDRLQQRMAFLAQAWLILDRSPSFDETLKGLAELTVPELAQLTVIDLRDEDGGVKTAVAAAEDPDHAREVETIRREHPLTFASGHPVAAVLRSGRPALLGAMSEDYQRGIAEGSAHFELMRRLRYHSAIVVPLVARQRVLGALSLLRLEGAEEYGEDDLVLAEELARRAALTIDNARLFETTRQIAGTLQESLLPRSLPEIPQVEIAGRYRAAGQGQQVGGDFYDVFAAGENRWTIVIGDVCGKGPNAAALTALARYTIRAVADRHAGRILEVLNNIVVRDRRSLPQPFLTAIVAIATAVGDRLDVEIAGAGHPAPLVLRGTGAVERVAAYGPMIGLQDAVEYSEQHLALNAGDTLMLYTDGLTDAQAPAHVLSEADVIGLLARGHGLPAPELATALEASATAGGEHRDDIALLVIQRMALSSGKRPARHERRQRPRVAADA
jgi:PAS domain S-box-containing protein